MIRTLFAAVAAAALGIGIVNANEIAASKTKFVKLDHVFLIMMENQTDTDILGNSNAPFINSYANVANQAKNYWAVGHPSAPNYLEIVGGSNFGLTNDFWPNWVNGGCVDNAPGSTGCVNALPPIAVSGLDNTVVATATNTSQCNGQVDPGNSPTPNNCALYTYNSTSFTPKSIADQLVAARKSWKTYQESLPTVVPGVDGVNYSDGVFSNLSPAAVFGPGAIQKLYAVKHNPFAYFKNIQQGTTKGLSFEQIQDFDGPQGLWADLATGDMPDFSLIVPNQCHDMHGFVTVGPPICNAFNPTEAGFLMQEGDATVRKLVTGIKASEAWQKGKNVIVLVWDENDFTNSPNRVVMLVETSYAKNGKKSTTAYDHFSLLRTLEAGFGLPCLNHACDTTSLIMNDMFGN